MELSDAVRARRMVRTYQPDRPVPAELITQALDLAGRSPSAGHTQGWDFVVLRSAEQRALFWAVTTDPHADPDPWLRGMRTAPVLILCLSDPMRYLDRYAEPDKGWSDRDENRWPVPYWDVDTGMAAFVMLLSAVDRGLGACFFGVRPEDRIAVLEAFDAPTDRRIVGVVSLGYAAPDRRSPSLRRGRRPLAEVAHDGRFGVPWPGSGTQSVPGAHPA
ncbi:MAG TPA: nitroreductase family protein [Kineosporiaceae bacterium]